MLGIALMVALCYLLGAIPFPVIVSRLVRGIDIREHGSGNMGAMNSARVLGFKWFPVVFGLDFAKGYGAAWLAMQFIPGFMPMDAVLAAAIGGCVAVIGHCFPVYVGFKGGVGLAASAGALAFISPWLLVATAVAILVFWGLTRNMYVGVALASLAAPVLGWYILHDLNVVLAVTAWAAVVFGVHFKDVRTWWVARGASKHA